LTVAICNNLNSYKKLKYDQDSVYDTSQSEILQLVKEVDKNVLMEELISNTHDNSSFDLVVLFDLQKTHRSPTVLLANEKFIIQGFKLSTFHPKYTIAQIHKKKYWE
jgi:hypothetical protein